MSADRNADSEILEGRGQERPRKHPRLERVEELSGPDPFTSEDRERLGLGLQAYRIIRSRLPR